MLCGVKHNEVLVEVVEVTRVHLVEIVGELSLCVPLSSNATIEVHYAESVAVEDDAQDAGDGLRMTGGGSDVDFAGVGEGIVGAGTLPERNGFGVDELGVLVMECVGLEEHVGGGAELRQHDDVLEVLGREPLLTTDIEQGAHSGKTVHIQGHSVGGVPDELRVEGRRTGSETLTVLSVESGKKVDSFGTAGAGDGGTAELGIYGFRNHVVDGTHNEGVVLDRHRLLHFVEKHGDEGIELGGAGERLLHLLFSYGAVDFKGGHLVEELDLSFRLMENVRVVTGAIDELPVLVLDGVGHLAVNFLHNGAELPTIHKNGGRGAAVGSIDENDLANVVDEALDILVESLLVEDSVANVDDIGKVLREYGGIADCFGCGGVDELVDLRYFHDNILL